MDDKHKYTFSVALNYKAIKPTYHFRAKDSSKD